MEENTMNDNFDNEMDKAYEPKKYEDDIYKMWEEGGYFGSQIDDQKVPYVISMPPPNATGVLHLGHVVFVAVSDAQIRYQRMCGKNVLWLPGTDHAAIATQTKVEKILAKEEGKSRHDYGREKFVEKVKEFVENSRSTIRKQLKKTGASCDWEREAYTLSDELSLAVNTAFEKMHKDGLIYRGDRIVNWCPRCGSTLADDEIEYKEAQTILYTFKYSHNFPFEIATTRPETKLADTAVAVNPADERYKKYIGQEIPVEFCGQKLVIKVIADEEVDMNFGTGALGVTPAHSYVDFEMAQKNGLKVIKIIGEDGKLNSNAGRWADKTVEEAREDIVKCLREDGLMSKEEEISHNISVCYRCGTAVEPLTSEQWFVNVNKKISGWQLGKIDGLTEGRDYSLKDVSRLVVQTGQVRLLPKRFEKVYFAWMDNLRDWCVSRQIWWGHRIPVWYREKVDGHGKKNHEIFVGTKEPEGEGWEQDNDTLDTWFSSSLWTFSSLGWPKETADLAYYHPTDLMVTGREIIFQWVARMILMSTYLLGEIPFRDVYLTGILFDKNGNKMSKSLGNVIDPLEMIEKYGTDALRLSVINGMAPGVDFRFQDEKIVGQRNFVNKLWNIGRFIFANLDSEMLQQEIDWEMINKMDLKMEDRWILSGLTQLRDEVTNCLNEYRLSMASEKLHSYIWDDLADWYLEMVKPDLFGTELARKLVVQHVLIYVFRNVLKLAHPFMPFVTEALWSYFSPSGLTKLIVAKWPEKMKVEDEEAMKKMRIVQEMVVTVRKMIADFGLMNEKNISLFLKLNNAEDVFLQEKISGLIKNICEVQVVAEFDAEVIHDVCEGGSVGFVIDEQMKNEQRKRVLKEIDNLQNYQIILQKKLANEKYVANAPKETVENDRMKMVETNNKLEELNNMLAKFQ